MCVCVCVCLCVCTVEGDVTVNTIIIEGMAKANSTPSLVDFRMRDVIGSLPVATRRWFDIGGVRPKSARATNELFLCQLVTLGGYDY